MAATNAHAHRVAGELARPSWGKLLATMLRRAPQGIFTMPNHNSTLGGGGFHHIALRARDFDASVRFYTQGLGFTPKITWNDKPKRAVMLDTGDGNYLEIFERPDQPRFDEKTAGEPPLLHFALRTTDCDAALARALAAGAALHMDSKSIDIQAQPQVTPVRIAFVRGPDGELIEFFQNELT
jgi:glyoxylase I family protein